MEVTRVRMKKREGQKGEQEGKASWRRETQRGRRKAAGIHGILERDAGQSKWFLRRNNNTGRSDEGIGSARGTRLEQYLTNIWSSRKKNNLFPKFLKLQLKTQDDLYCNGKISL